MSSINYFKAQYLQDTLRINPADMVTITGWYAIAKHVYFRIENELSIKSVSEYLQQTQFLEYLYDSSLIDLWEDLSPDTRTEEIFDLCHWLNDNQYLDNPTDFFRNFCPCIVSNWPSFETNLKNYKSDIFTILYIILKAAGEALGNPQIVPIDSSEMFALNKSYFDKIGIDAGIYEECWEAVHFSKTEVYISKNTSTPIENARNAYKKYPKAKLLEDVLLAKQNAYVFNNGVPLNPWRSIPRNVYTSDRIERGFTEDEKLFNDAAYYLLKTPATDIIHSLFYKRRDDILFEGSLLLNELFAAIPHSQNITIVNPSPSFLIAYEKKKKKRIPLTYVVSDQTVRDLYHTQFPLYNFVLPTELEHEIDLLIYMQRDLSLNIFSKVFSLCKENAQIIAMVPQSSRSPNGEYFFEFLQKTEIFPHTILSIPSCSVESSPKKKLMIYARKGTQHSKQKIHLVFSHMDELQEYIVTEKTSYCVPYERFFENNSLTQIRKSIDKIIAEPEVQHRENASVIPFSKEISICATIFPGRKGKFSARAFYRAIPRDEDKYRKFGRRITPTTEKGLTAGSETEILSKISAVALYDEFSTSIIDDITTFYGNQMESLTLKTLWFCCRPDLLTMITYDDEAAILLFCGDNQALSYLYPENATSEQFSEAMLCLIPPNSSGELKYWKLLNLIIKKAIAKGYIHRNPIAYCLPFIEQRRNNALSQIRSNLSKHSFTDLEEEKMVHFLFEPRQSDGTYRCVYDGKWLIAAIRLFTGLPIREICALQWKHFKQIEEENAYLFEIVQYLDAKNQLRSYIQYHNLRKLRKMPLPPILALILKDRLVYLQRKYGYQLEDILEHPIILESEPNDRRKRKNIAFCNREIARNISRKLLEIANIKEDWITLLDGEQQFSTNLSATSRDLYYANFRHKCTVQCGFTDGQLSYITGTKPEDTLSEHYIDFANSFLQYDMVCRLNRWTCIYPKQTDIDTTNVSFNSTKITDTSYDEVVPETNRLAVLHLGITIPPKQQPGELTITVKTHHGTLGKITAYK